MTTMQSARAALKNAVDVSKILGPEGVGTGDGQGRQSDTSPNNQPKLRNG